MFASHKMMKLWACRLSYLSTRPITQFFGNKMLKNGRGQTQLTHTPKRRIYTKKTIIISRAITNPVENLVSVPLYRIYLVLENMI